MTNEEIMKHLREIIEKQMTTGQASPETIFMYLQLQLLDKLEEVNGNLEQIDNHLSDIESSISQLDGRGYQVG